MHLDGIFPPGVALATRRPTRDGDGDLRELSLAELAVVQGAVAARQREFAAGRHAARIALRELGIKRWELLADAQHAPIWPPATTGSISHTADLCIAVAAHRREFRSVGVDVERRLAVEEKLWSTVLTEREAGVIRKLPESQRTARASLVFSAKESFYKCQYQITAHFLDFDDVEIVVEPDRFCVVSSVVGIACTSYYGRYRSLGEYVTTACWCPVDRG